MIERDKRHVGNFIKEKKRKNRYATANSELFITIAIFAVEIISFKCIVTLTSFFFY